MFVIKYAQARERIHNMAIVKLSSRDGLEVFLPITSELKNPFLNCHSNIVSEVKPLRHDLMLVYVPEALERFSPFAQYRVDREISFDTSFIPFACNLEKSC